MLTATVRTVIRIRSQGRLAPDDYMLIFACVTLIASTVLLFDVAETVYWDEALILDPSPATLAEAFLPTFPAKIMHFQQKVFAYLSLTWTTIFAVKLSFLLFFRSMVDRVKKMELFWKVVFGITVVFYCYCAAAVYMGCSKFGLAACKFPLPYASYMEDQRADRGFLERSEVRPGLRIHQEFGSCSQ